jgi:hypothetical protein
VTKNYNSVNKLESITYGFTIARFRELQFYFNETGQALALNMRWETNSTTYSASGVHNSFHDDWTFTLTGPVNECMGAQVSMANADAQRTITVEAGTTQTIDALPISVNP